MMELGERKRRILGAIVHDYVEMAEPVGSEALAQRHNLGVRPATIRNEMAAMSELGYLRQPHTSAGRIPSDLGYRYYVDRLMPAAKLRAGESRRAVHGYNRCAAEIDELLQQTCRILSGLTTCASLATPPRSDSVYIKHVAVSMVSPGKLLVVTVLNMGHIDHRMLDFDGVLTSTDLLAVGNLVNERLKGADVHNISGRAGNNFPLGLSGLKGLYSTIAALVREALASAESDDIYVDGTSNILREPEFSGADRMTAMLGALEHRKALYQVLSTALLGPDVTVIIGSENRFEEMNECSFVAAPYSVGGKVCGSIGVVGPTRMDYCRAVGAVKFMASNLSEMLTSLSVG